MTDKPANERNSAVYLELLSFAASAPRFDLTLENLAAARSATVEMFEHLAESPVPPEVITIPGSNGRAIELRIYRPPGKRIRPALYFIHGGGYVLGTAAMRDGLNWQLAYDSDAAVIAVDYRLAPETTFPGPLEDCFCGLMWVFANAAKFHIDAARVVLLGESAGGGLAAALAHWVRDKTDIRLAGQMLVYPMLDHRTGTTDEVNPNPTTGLVGWTRENNRFGWECLRGDNVLGAEEIGYFSPAHAIRVDGLPPTFVAVGALDLFMDENLAYASRLSRAGVPVTFHLYPGAIHGFDLMSDTALAQQFRFDQQQTLRRWLKGSQLDSATGA